MFDCSIDKYVFWFGFLIGGFICTAIFEIIQITILSISGVKKLDEEMKRIILLSLISANTFATELKLSDLAATYPTYKL